MLDIEAVTKTFFRRAINERVALNDISLHFNPRDFVTIIDSNDAGKSTLFNTVLGRYQADIGRMRIGGENMTKLSDYRVAKYVSRIFRDSAAGTTPHLSIEESLALIRS